MKCPESWQEVLANNITSCQFSSHSIKFNTIIYQPIHSYHQYVPECLHFQARLPRPSSTATVSLGRVSSGHNLYFLLFTTDDVYQNLRRDLTAWQWLDKTYMVFNTAITYPSQQPESPSRTQIVMGRASCGLRFDSDSTRSTGMRIRRSGGIGTRAPVHVLESII